MSQVKNILALLFLVFTYTMHSQNIDFNTKKGFVVEGFDVVSYFNNSPEKGSANYISKYKGGTFKFTSQKHLELFNKNPEKYIPQYGGYCAYAIAAKGEKVSIDPETFEIREGKLYLFYNLWGINTLKPWQDEAPEYLKLQADINWERLRKE